MKLAPSALLVVVAIVLPSRAWAGEVVSQDDRVAVTLNFGDQATADRCRALLDRAVALDEAKLPYHLPYTSDSNLRMVFHLYANQASYAQACEDAGAAQRANVYGFTSNASFESYLRMGPRYDPAYLDLLGGDLPEFTLHLAFHEAVHQLVMRATPGHGYDWPDWYAEGMAESLATLCFEEQIGGLSPRCQIADDGDRFAMAAIEQGTVPALPSILGAVFDKTDDRFSYYMLSQSFYRFLATDGARLEKLHRAVLDIDAKEADFEGTTDERKARKTDAVAKAVAAIFGPLPDLEKRWHEWVLARPRPRFFHWIAPTHEVPPAGQLVGDEIVLAATQGAGTSLLAADRPGGDALVISCELFIVGLDVKDAEVWLGWQDRPDPHGMKVVLRGVDEVDVRVMKGGQWTQVAAKPLEQGTIPVGRWAKTRVTVSGGSLHVEVEGALVYEGPVPDGIDAVHGRWGLGAWSDVVRYRDVKAGEP